MCIYEFCANMSVLMEGDSVCGTHGQAAMRAKHCFSPRYSFAT